MAAKIGRRSSVAKPYRPAADSERAFVHSVDGRVTAIELADGKQAWSYESAMPVLTVRGTSTPLVLEQLWWWVLPAVKWWRWIKSWAYRVGIAFSQPRWTQ